MFAQRIDTLSGVFLMILAVAAAMLILVVSVATVCWKITENQGILKDRDRAFVILGVVILISAAGYVVCSILHV